jgi:hypothetical protein
MRPPQRLAAQQRVVVQPVLLDLQAERRETRILEPPHIEMPVPGAGPAEERVRRGLHGPLADHHPLAAGGEPGAPGERLQHRGLRLLDLQQQLLAVRGREQADRAEGADAADPHHLEQHVDQPVAPQQQRPVRRQRRDIAGEGQPSVVLVLRQPHRQRRGLAQSRHAIRPRLDQAVTDRLAPQPLRQGLPRASPGAMVGDGLDRVDQVDPLRPRLDRRQRRQPGDLRDVGAGGVARQRPGSVRGKAGLASAQDQAGAQSLEVPFERRRQGLVEIVDVEHRPAFRRGEAAEIGQVTVAAALHHEPGPLCPRQVGGHHRGGAAQERQRRGLHAAVADRQQRSDPAPPLRLQDGDRVGPARRRRPHGMRCAGCVTPKRPPGRTALPARRSGDRRQRAHRRASTAQIAPPSSDSSSGDTVKLGVR